MFPCFLLHVNKFAVSSGYKKAKGRLQKKAEKESTFTGIPSVCPNIHLDVLVLDIETLWSQASQQMYQPIFNPVSDNGGCWAFRCFIDKLQHINF